MPIVIPCIREFLAPRRDENGSHFCRFITSPCPSHLVARSFRAVTTAAEVQVSVMDAERLRAYFGL